MKLSEVLKSKLDSIKENLDQIDKILESSNLDLKSEEEQWLEDWSRIVD
jgi:hypothetical protein